MTLLRPSPPSQAPAHAGANIVPAHVFEPAATPARLSRLVADAKAAHMNMLRVWGGGRYFKGVCEGLAGLAGGMPRWPPSFPSPACDAGPRPPSLHSPSSLPRSTLLHSSQPHPSTPTNHTHSTSTTVRPPAPSPPPPNSS
jgi:hypothetical protein